MDDWVESPLNKAHFYDRRANALVRKLQFDEAIECHLSAAKYLTESLKVTENVKAKESLQLQKQYHLKEKDFLLVKKNQFQTLKEVIRVQKEAMSRMMKARDSNGRYSESENEEVTLQRVIYRTIEEADSLLDVLLHKEESKETCSENTVVKELNTDIAHSKGILLPKDDKTIIEELRIVNYQLRTLVSELIAKLTASEKEVVSLTQRVAELETENKRLESDFVGASNYSPFVFSPEDELPPKTRSELPALAPLEMPNFDMSVLQKYHLTNH